MKRTMTSIMAALIVTTAVLGSGTIEAKAYDRCGYNGCNAENTANGTVFCDTHAAQYAREKGYKACAASGCWGYASKDSSYCSKHTCSNSKCTNKVVGDTRYCSTHTEKTTSTKSSSKSSYSTKKKSSSSSKTKSSSKKKYDAYDVYSYKSAQDFADDKYEEFYDYEDDYEDEDEAYDAAEDYWRDHH